MKGAVTRRCLVLPLLAALAGCGAIDPLTRPGVWHPIGANDANLRATVANPQDLVNGAASPLADGTLAAAAVARYHADRVKPLPDSGLAAITLQGSGSSAAAAPAAPGQN